MDNRSEAAPTRRRVVAIVATLVGATIAMLLLLPTAATDRDVPRGAAPPGPTPTASERPGAESRMDSEAPPPPPDASDTLPLVASAAPLITAPFPDSASTSGALVDGFPAEAIGPLPNADIVESAIVSGPDAMQATLVARTDSPGADVIEQLRQRWASLGLTQQSASSAGDLAFEGAYETFTLSLQPSSGTGTVYVISAVFHTD